MVVSVLNTTVEVKNLAQALLYKLIKVC